MRCQHAFVSALERQLVLYPPFRRICGSQMGGPMTSMHESSRSFEAEAHTMNAPMFQNVSGGQMNIVHAVCFRGRPPRFLRCNLLRGTVPAQCSAWYVHRKGHTLRVPAPGESLLPHIFCFFRVLAAMKYSGSVVRSSTWPQRRRSWRISARQDFSSRLPITRCVGLWRSHLNLETARESFPIALPSNR